MKLQLISKEALKMNINGEIKQHTFYLLIVLSLLIANGCNIKQKKEGKIIKANNTLTETEKKEGWVLLFDGKTFDGWRGLGLNKAYEGWIIEDQSIKIIPKSEGPRQADGQPILGGDLISVETYENFELIWDWKLNTKGNSGIKYNVSEELSLSWPPSRAALGWEYQMIDDSSLSDQASMDNSSGALYDMIAPNKDKVIKPIGEFNSSRIIVNGNHCEHWLNGKKVLEYEMGSAQFDSLFRKSKFKDIPGFANKKNGHIALQDHAEASWFRNIKIRRLDTGNN